MNIKAVEPRVATKQEAAAILQALAQVDNSGMKNNVLELPTQILEAIEASSNFSEGEIPLDRSRGHLLGLGGSAIAGELLRDMIAPKQIVSVHRGTLPQRDKSGVVISSYSGNTKEILELTPQLIGGLKSTIFITSGGKLEELGKELSVPVWKMPSGYQPREAVGWSLALLTAILERWRVLNNVQGRLQRAAERLKSSLQHRDSSDHLLVRAAVPIAEALVDRTGIILHSLRCQGAGRRFAAQITENAKQPAFAIVIPEAMHNAVEGIAGGDPDRWTLIFMSDPDDPPFLRAAINKVIAYFSQLGFQCLPFPASGEGQYELTLSRVLIGDFASLFLAAKKRLDPTPIKTILALKKLDEAEER